MTDSLQELRIALAEAGAVLEALNASVTWELAPELKLAIRTVLEDKVRPALEKGRGVTRDEAEAAVLKFLAERCDYSPAELDAMEVSVEPDGEPMSDGQHYVFDVYDGDCNEPGTVCIGSGYVHGNGFVEGLY